MSVRNAGLPGTVAAAAGAVHAGHGHGQLLAAGIAVTLLLGLAGSQTFPRATQAVLAARARAARLVATIVSRLWS